MKKLFLWTLLSVLLGTSAVALADTIPVLLIPVETEGVAADIYIFDPFDGAYLGVFATDSVNTNPRYNAISGPDGNIYASEYGGNKVHVLDAAGNYLYTYADATDGLEFIRGIAFRGDSLFIPNNTHVAVFDGPHSRLPDFIPSVVNPHEIFFLEDGRCLVSVAAEHLIRLYNADGTPSADLFYTPNIPQQIQSDPELPGAYLNATYEDVGYITDFDLDGTIHNMLFNHYGGGIYRLGNGNLLVTDGSGSTGGVYEFTDAGDTVDVELSGMRCYWIELCIVEVGGSECAYLPGDCDHNGTALELADVIAMIGIYRGMVEPYYTCDCPPHGDTFAPEADPNGNCVTLELADVVTEIGAYRGTAEAAGCPDCPGSLRLMPGGDEMPLVMPTLKSNTRINSGSNAE